MSSWYVLSSLGIFPACVGDPNYTLTSPLFDRAVIHLDNGKSFIVNAHKNSKENTYVQSRELDAKRYDPQTILHSRLLEGGELNVEMGPLPVTR